METLQLEVFPAILPTHLHHHPTLSPLTVPGVRRLEDLLLPFRQSLVLFGFVVLRVPGYRVGRVLVEQRAAFVAVPGHGAVGQRFGEDHGGAGLAGHGADEGLVGLEIAPLVGEAKVALVAAGHAAEATVAGVHILQVVGDHGQAAPDLLVDAGVGIERVEGDRPAVKGRADGAVALSDDVGVVVIQPEPRSDDLLQVGDDARVVDQVAEGGSPVEQRKAKPVRGRAGFHCPVDLLVQDAVQFGELFGVEGVRDRDEALQVEEVLLMGGHGPPFRGAVPFVGRFFVRGLPPALPRPFRQSSSTA